MSPTTLRDAFENRERPLVLDGGLGTYLRSLGEPPPYEPLSVGSQRVAEAHAEFAQVARCDIVTTNTFCAERSTIESHSYSDTYEAEWKRIASEHGYPDLPTTLWHESVRIAREAASSRRRGPCFVAGSIGPAGLKPEREEELREQMSALLSAGVDALLVETCTSREGALFANRVARELVDDQERDVLLIISFTLSAEGEIAPVSAREGEVEDFRKLDADVVSLNCGFGLHGFDTALTRLRELIDVPIGAYPNSGLPEERDGELIYPVGHDEFARAMLELSRNHQLALIGGCCGTSPRHIRRLTRAFPPAPPQP